MAPVGSITRLTRSYRRVILDNVKVRRREQPRMPRDIRSLLPLGMSLRAVARGTGLSQSMVTLVFQGRRIPSLRTAERIAGFLGISIDKLSAHLRVSMPVERP